MSENKKEQEVEQGGPRFDPPLYIQRYTTIKEILFKFPGVEKVADFGCSEGKFIKYLKNLPFVTEISCIDLHEPSLENASYISRPTAWDFVFRRHRPLSIKLLKGNVAEKDRRLQEYTAVTCIELIEHLAPDVLPLLPSNIFGHIQPKIAIFTTPNSEFNVLFPQLNGSFRHWDHKFEWNREQFRQWCEDITTQYPEYAVEIHGIGEAPAESSHLGCCTQMAIFKLTHPPRTIQSSMGSLDEPYTLIGENNYPGRKENSESTSEISNSTEEVESESIIS